MPEDLWNVRRTAAYLGWNEQTVYAKVRKGEIPCVRVGLSGKTIRFEPEVLREWFRKRQEGQAKEAESLAAV